MSYLQKISVKINSFFDIKKDPINVHWKSPKTIGAIPKLYGVPISNRLIDEIAFQTIVWISRILFEKLNGKQIRSRDYHFDVTVYFWSCAFQVVVMTIRLHHNFQIWFVLNVLEEARTHTCQKNWNENTQAHWYMRPNGTLCAPVCHHSTYTRSHAHIDVAKNESLYVLYAVQMYWCREDTIKGMNASAASVVDAIINSHLMK